MAALDSIPDHITETAEVWRANKAMIYGQLYGGKFGQKTNPCAEILSPSMLPCSHHGFLHAYEQATTVATRTILDPAHHKDQVRSRVTTPGPVIDFTVVIDSTTARAIRDLESHISRTVEMAAQNAFQKVANAIFQREYLDTLLPPAAPEPQPVRPFSIDVLEDAMRDFAFKNFQLTYGPIEDADTLAVITVFHGFSKESGDLGPDPEHKPALKFRNRDDALTAAHFYAKHGRFDGQVERRKDMYLTL